MTFIDLSLVCELLYSFFSKATPILQQKPKHTKHYHGMGDFTITGIDKTDQIFPYLLRLLRILHERTYFVIQIRILDVILIV
jgi:hypothetical protein